MLKLFKTKLMALVIAVTLSSGFVFADWIDDLANKVYESKSWDQEYASVLEKYIQEDAQKITKIEAKIESLNSDFWSKVKYSAYYVELKTVKTEKEYHEKVVRVLLNLHENKNDREKLIKNLISLKEANDKLENLSKKEQDTCTCDKAKVYLKIGAKKTEIAAKKGLIKGFFLI